MTELTINEIVEGKLQEIFDISRNLQEAWGALREKVDEDRMASYFSPRDNYGMMVSAVSYEASAKYNQIHADYIKHCAELGLYLVKLCRNDHGIVVIDQRR